jgi:hypothetical protein
MSKYQLGEKLKDTVTGLTGIATQKCEMLNGCVQFYLQPPRKKDGDAQKGEWVDDQQLVKLDAGINRKVSGTGGGVVHPSAGSVM